MTITLPRISDLDGALWRGDDGWYWADGTFEPRVRDLWLEEIAPHWRRIERARRTWVEIPTEWRTQVQTAELVRALTELVRQYAAIAPIHDTGTAAIIGERGQQRSGYRVPLDAWQVVMHQPCGATWSPADNAAIRARARRQPRDG